MKRELPKNFVAELKIAALHYLFILEAPYNNEKSLAFGYTSAPLAGAKGWADTLTQKTSFKGFIGFQRKPKSAISKIALLSSRRILWRIYPLLN